MILFEATSESPNLNDFVSKVESLVHEYENKGVELDVRLRHYQSVEINLIRVKKELQGKGLASEFMDKISHLADEYLITLTLSPSDSFGSNINKLKKFYNRFGFKMNTGSKADHRFSNSMIRKPK